MARATKGPSRRWRPRTHLRNPRRRFATTALRLHRAGLERGRNTAGVGGGCLRTAADATAAGSSCAGQSGHRRADRGIETDRYADGRQSINSACTLPPAAPYLLKIRKHVLAPMRKQVRVFLHLHLDCRDLLRRKIVVQLCLQLAGRDMSIDQTAIALYAISVAATALQPKANA